MAGNITTVRLEITVDVITDNDYHIFVNIYVFVFIAMGIAGTVTNCINIFVFVKMGLTDSITVNFFSISVADLGVTLFAVLSGLSQLLSNLEANYGIWFFIDPFVIRVLSLNTMTSMIGGSILLTTYLAIQRCCCVALPFGFRRIFTKSFTVYVIIGIAVIVLFLISGFASLYSAEWRPVGDMNYSKLRLIARPHRTTLHSYLHIIELFVMTMGCEIIVLFCLIVMVVGLRRSADFRQRSTGPGQTKSDIDDDETDANDYSDELTTTKGTQQQSEFRLMKTVILISTLFVTCNCPAVVLGMLRMLVDGFDTYGGLTNSYRVTLSSMLIFQLMNSSLNVFIYTESNTKFSTILKTRFKCL